MNSTAVQYAGALRHAGCTLSELRRTAGCLTGFFLIFLIFCTVRSKRHEK